MIDKQTNILKKIDHLKNTILDYAAYHYDANHWPTELQYDFDHIETIEMGIVEYNDSITNNQMKICNGIYKNYLL